MHALDSHLFWFQSLTFPCSKTLLKHRTCHALHSTKSNYLWVSDSELMLVICQSNVQAVTKIRHLLESGNTPGEAQTYLVTSHTHSCTQKDCNASRKTPSWQPIRLPAVLLHDLCGRSPLQGLQRGVKPHRTGTPHPQPQAGKFNTRTPLQSKNNVSPLLQSVNPYAAFLSHT